MSNKNLFLDVHALQTVPPSNINRDDTGSPKTAQYGGVTRTRVSSQSWKMAIRKYFLENGDNANVGVRSKNIPEYIAKEIRKIDENISEEDSIDMACKILESGGIKLSDKKMKALFFLGQKQAENLAKIAIEGSKDKKEIQTILNKFPAIDMALFGRMVADDPSLNEDASCQVAHAISTHAIQTEFDFFTAVDDLAPENNAGAGMLGTVEYNSATLYRYANVAIHELYEQLGGQKDEVINALKLFIEAFVKSMPTGKINTFANQTLPQVFMINLREDRPVSLVSAFENPVKQKDGYLKQSAERMFDELKNVEKFVKKPIFSLLICVNDIEAIDNVEIKGSLNELLEDFGERLKEEIKES